MADTRKMNQDHTLQNEGRYKRLFQHMNQGFALFELIADADQNPLDYKFLEINPAFSRLTGIKAEKILNRNVTEVFPDLAEESAIRLRKYAKAVFTGEDISFEEYSPEFKRWFLIHAFSVGKQQFAVTFADITENKLLENEYKASEHKFRALVEQSLTGIYIFDSDKFLYVNKRFCEIFGYTEEEILTKLKPTDVVKAGDYNRANEFIRKRLDGELDYAHYIAEGKHKSDKLLWIEIHGTHVRLNNKDVITGTVLDITERFESQRIINESENKFRAAFEQSPNGICITSLQGVLIQVNQPLCDILGYSKKELTGKHFNEITHPEDFDKGADFVEGLLSGEVQKGSFRKRYLAKDGKSVWVNISSALVRDGEDKATHFITQVEDITEQKLAEEQVKLSEERFSKIFNSGPSGVAISRISDGKFIDANQYFLDLFEFSREEVIGKTSTEVKMWTPEERKKIIEAQVKTGGLVSTELTAYSKSGKAVHIIFSSKPIKIEHEDCLITSMIDITDRKKVEKELIESDLKFRTLFEQAAVGVAIIETATGRYRSVNDRQCEIMGYSKQELMQAEFMSVTHPDDLGEDLQNMEMLKQGVIENYIIDKRYIHKDGHHAWVRLNVSPLWKKGEPQVFHVALCEDITERKITEQSLVESESRYRSLFENMNAGFVLFEVVQNAQGTPVDLLIVAANKGFETTTGLNLKDATGQNLTSVLPGIEDDEADWIGTYSKIALTGESKQFEQISELLDTYYSVSAFQAGPKLCAVTFTDISKSKKAELALADSEERLRLSTELANIAVWEYNFPSNSMSRSPNHDQLYGLEWQTTWNLNTFLKATHPDDRDFSNKIIQKSVASGGPDDYTFDFRVVFPDKSIRWLMVKGRVIKRDSKGLGLIVRGTLTDITERKSIENEIKKLNESLEQKVKQRTAELEMANKELEAFTFTVSHDLRAPLRAIDGFSKFLIEDFEDKLDEEGNRLLKIIRENTSRMDQLISDLLQLSRINKNQIYVTRVDMEKLVHSVIDEALSEESKQTFEFNIKSLPQVPGDQNLLRQVWVNLLSNSIKYSGPSKTKKILINYSTGKEDYVFSIQDAGVGFNPRYKDKLFGIFQRLHNMEEFEGTGVGLAIVQRIVHRHGGKVWAESEINKGATFYFSLPKK